MAFHLLKGLTEYKDLELSAILLNEGRGWIAYVRVPSEGQGILTGESPDMLEVPSKAG